MEIASGATTEYRATFETYRSNSSFGSVMDERTNHTVGFCIPKGPNEPQTVARLALLARQWMKKASYINIEGS